MPSSPTNNSAPGSLPATSIRLSAALTRSFPVNSSNIIHREMAAALQERNDDGLQAFLRLLHWSTRIDQLHALRFGSRDLQVGIAHARVEVCFLDVESIARKFARRSTGRATRCAAGCFGER